MAAVEARLRAGESYSAVSRVFGMSRWSVGRHAREHMLLPAQTAPVVEIVDPAGQLVDLDGRLVRLEAVLTSALDAAARSGKTSQLVAAAREVRATVVELARLRGLLAEQRPVVVNVLQIPEVRELAGQLQRVLAPWPDARTAVVAALRAAEGEPDAD